MSRILPLNYFLLLCFLAPGIQAQAPSVSFCDAPAVLHRNTPLGNYSPLICLQYSGLLQQKYTVKIFLLETANFFCASTQWCGAVIPVDNSNGASATGKVFDARIMDVHDYPNFLWVADLYDQAGTAVFHATLPATSTTNQPPALGPIGDKVGSVGQPLELIVSATDPEGDALVFSAQNLPSGATFDPSTRKFSWPSPALGAYSGILFKVTQSGGIPLSDAELINIQISTSIPRQVLSFSSDRYSTGEGGPAVIVVNRTGGSTGTISVDYSTTGITASAGLDFVAISGTLTFGPGEMTKALVVSIINDLLVEPDETFRISLSNPSSSVDLGTFNIAIITIIDDDTPSKSGKWSDLIPFPVIPIHMSLLPNGKILLWDRHDDVLGWNGDPRIWDPVSNTFTSTALPGYDLFCSGHVLLADGTLLVAGGHIPMPPATVASGVGENKVSIYNFVTNIWTRLANMNLGRWYPSALVLANGDALVIAGTSTGPSAVNPVSQIWQVGSSTWRYLTNATQGGYFVWADYYPFTYLAPNGKVFIAGPQKTSRYLDTTGTGTFTDVANSSLQYRDYGTSVLLADQKVLIIGGNSREPDPNAAPTIFPSPTAESINLNDAIPAWSPIASMSVGRRHANSTVLPDGKILVTGGSSLPGFDNPAGAVYYGEMFDSVSGLWTITASHTRYRGYHSNAILLPDARVVVTGGGHPDPAGGTAQLNAEIYSPPYLFKGPRPVIQTAPSQVAYGQSFLVQTPDNSSIASATLIRLPSVTHAFNQNQRIIQLSVSQSQGGLTLGAPSNSQLCPPGHYMLFLVNNSGVPSVASILQVLPVLTQVSISGQVTMNGAAFSGVTMTLAGGSGGNQLTASGNYSFTGLPTGVNYTVTPTLANYTFTPPNATFTNLQSNQTANFIATPLTYTISGQVTKGGGAFSGVTLTLAGGSNSTQITSGSGSYSFTNLPAGLSYTVSPSLANYSFTPASAAVPNLSSNVIANFTGTPKPGTGVPDKVGTTYSGFSVLDANGNFAWDGPTTDKIISWSTFQASEKPIYGDWNGDGKTKVGVYNNGTWLLDYNGNGVWDGPTIDKAIYWSTGQSTDVPVMGDWNGDGRTKIGIYNNGTWILDYNGNGVWEGPGVDKTIYWSTGQAGEVPVVGDWNGDGKTKIGVHVNGTWILEYNGNYAWDGTGVDKLIYFGGPGYRPMVGDWNGSGWTKIGAYNVNGTWALDFNGNFVWDGTSIDKLTFFGGPEWLPVVGDWSGSGTTKIGAYTGGQWALDYNGNLAWDLPPDRLFSFGAAGQTPIVGKW